MLVLKNATTLQFDPPSVRHGVDLVVDGTKIIAVGQNIASRYKADRVLALDGRILSPGLVCSHNHFYSGLARGIMAGIKPSPDFVSILKNLWWRLDRGIDEEILYYSGLVGALEAVKSGTTAVIDHHASPSFIKGSLKVLKDGFEKAGLRGITCFEVTDRNGITQMRAEVEENIAFAESVDAGRDDEHHLVEALIGGHAPFTLPDEGLALLAEAVQVTGRGIHIHVAEDKYDALHSHAVYGKDVLERLAGFHLLNSKGIIVHGVHLSENDIGLLNQHDCFLVHNPRSNMNNGVGYSRRLAEVKNLALGTDGIGSDMYEELKFAYFKHKDDNGPLWPDGFLRFLQNGNILLERNFGEKFGQLEPGYKADLVISDYLSPTPLVAENIAGHMAFGMGSRDVNTVIINGRIVYENRQFPFDLRSIYEQARKAARRLWENMDNLE
ncbi:MAG: putative aminohydrolase SsnA [Spirochaetota bacterium]